MRASWYRRAGIFPRKAIRLYRDRLSAGFPSPAEDYIDSSLDLNELCIQHPAASYFVRVSGHSMLDAGVNDGDLVIIDRSIEPRHGHIVVAAVDGELTLKRLVTSPKRQLVPENSNYSPISLDGESDIQLHGVATWLIRSLRE